MFSWYDEVQKIKSWVDRNEGFNIQECGTKYFNGLNNDIGHGLITNIIIQGGVFLC